MEQWKHAHPADREVITLQQLTLAQAADRFPGCDDEEVRTLVASGPVTSEEPDYFRLFVHEGRLLSCVYEISYLGWSLWQDGAWHDLDGVDWELDSRFQRANLVFLDPVS